MPIAVLAVMFFGVMFRVVFIWCPFGKLFGFVFEVWKLEFGPKFFFRDLCSLCGFFIGSGVAIGAID